MLFDCISISVVLFLSQSLSLSQCLCTTGAWVSVNLYQRLQVSFIYQYISLFYLFVFLSIQLNFYLSISHTEDIISLVVPLFFWKPIIGSLIFNLVLWSDAWVDNSILPLWVLFIFYVLFCFGVWSVRKRNLNIYIKHINNSCIKTRHAIL